MKKSRSARSGSSGPSRSRRPGRRWWRFAGGTGLGKAPSTSGRASMAAWRLGHKSPPAAPIKRPQRLPGTEPHSAKHTDSSQPCGKRQKPFKLLIYKGKIDGGEEGIRTLGRALRPYNGLANRRLRPLGHLSAAWDTWLSPPCQRRPGWIGGLTGAFSVSGRTAIRGPGAGLRRLLTGSCRGPIRRGR